MKFRLLGLLLVVAAFGSQALTLGRLRGAALVGRGLDVSVQVQLDPGEALANGCFEADVFHGDNRQDGSKVRVSVEPTSVPQSVNVRVVSTASIDEPVVTVYMRATCGQQLSRRYVLLADVVTEQPAAAATTSVPLPGVSVPVVTVPAAASDTGAASAVGAAAAPATTAAAAAAASMASPGTSAVAARPATQVVAKPKRPAAVRAAPKAAAPLAPKPAAVASRPTTPPASTEVADKLQAGRAAGQSRLKLDQLEVLAGRVATLESTTATVPAEAAARETREARRVAAMEANIKSLLALAAKNDTNLLDMRARLERAESERYANPVVYGLVILLLLLLVLIALLLRRSSQSGSGTGSNWWSNTGNGMPGGAPTQVSPDRPRSSGFTAASAPAPLSAPSGLYGADASDATQRTGPRSAQAPITQVDVSLVEMSESTFDRLMQSGVTHSAVRKPRVEEAQDTSAAPALPQHRSINSEELFDIRQQAEFFVSLGQTDQAVRILENRISQNGESSPLAYLDLLKIFHSLGLKADFRQVREDFNLLFNASVPEFAAFNEEGRDLEAYADVLERIGDDWGTPAIFAAIETSLFRGSWNSGSQPFDLAAFRDLLLLHAVSQWSLSASESLPAPLVATLPPASLPGKLGYASASAFGGLSAANFDYSATTTQPQADAPLPSIDGAGDLDIDLSDLYASPSPSPVQGDSGATVDTVAVPSPAGDVDNLIDFDLSGFNAKDVGKPK